MQMMLISPNYGQDDGDHSDDSDEDDDGKRKKGVTTVNWWESSTLWEVSSCGDLRDGDNGGNSDTYGVVMVKLMVVNLLTVVVMMMMMKRKVGPTEGVGLW